MQSKKEFTTKQCVFGAKKFNQARNFTQSLIVMVDNEQ